MRIFCHYLLDRIPDEGLEEVRSSLDEAIDYYKYESSSPIAKLPTAPYAIQIGQPHKRPTFEVSED